VNTVRWALVDGAGCVDAQQWDALVQDNDPFMEHGFLQALEEAACVGPRAGWVPRFVLAWAKPQAVTGATPGAASTPAEELVGAIPLYLKDNSYGEFIFDWGWAQGSEQAGIPYYPKLVSAAPFTPATGNRILLASAWRTGEKRTVVVRALLDGVQATLDETQASSVHFLFCTKQEALELKDFGFAHRLSMQFHWENRTPEPYVDFDDYLSAFRSSNRKQVRKERKRAQSHGLELLTLTGDALEESDWAALWTFYLANADRHGAIPYLNREFFEILQARHGHRVVATLAKDGSRAIAGTLNFERGSQLYGRYWGAQAFGDMLHFELCYYALIERAIERKLTRFEAGAQGEHKLKRGLLPTLTHSAHLIRHPALFRAVGGFVRQEQQAVRDRVEHYQEHSPFARFASQEQSVNPDKASQP